MPGVDQERFIADVVESADRIQFEDMLQGGRHALNFGGAAKVDGETEKARDEAAALAKNPTVLDHLCPALNSVSSDLGSVSKTVGAVLLPLALVPGAAIPLSALAFGALAVIITRAGVAGVCAGRGAAAKAE